MLDEGDKLLQDNFAGDIQTLKIIITDTVFVVLYACLLLFCHTLERQLQLSDIHV